jgi:hypothetical protein
VYRQLASVTLASPAPDPYCMNAAFIQFQRKAA